MKYLLNNWWGRLYLVLQIACLAMTIVPAVQFVKDDRVREAFEIEKLNRFYTVPLQNGQPRLSPWQERKALLGYTATNQGRGQLTIPPEDRGRLDFDINWAKDWHSETRREKMLFYLWPNLAVPSIFAIGLFVVKGLPKRNSPKSS